MPTFWTNQTIEAWNLALERCYLIGNPDYVWEDYREPYNWMIDQMKKRLPIYTDDFPIWVWIKKPDLRCGGYFEKGTHAVRLEVDLADQEVLISDFDAWHCVLSVTDALFRPKTDAICCPKVGPLSIDWTHRVGRQN